MAFLRGQQGGETPSAAEFRAHFDRLLNTPVNATDPEATAARARRTVELSHSLGIPPSVTQAGAEGVLADLLSAVGPHSLAERQAAASALNAPVSEGEVAAAVGKLHNYKAADVDGVCEEMVKHAVREVAGEGGKTVKVNVLVPHLSSLFGRMFSLGHFPVPYRMNRLTPLHKSGPRLTPTNYRGISVGKVVGKLFSSVLDARLSSFAERQGLRAPTQSGFRREMGTLNGAFVLNHLVEKHWAQKQPLYACLVDFKTAFDSVQRPLIWARLEERGVRGTMLAALQSLYDEVWIKVRAGGESSERFASLQGVKQGDPASPVLFGLFVEALHDMLERWCPGTGPTIAGASVLDLLFADDVILLATSPAHLQQQLDVLELFCLIFNMKVNLKKTEVIVFRPSRAPTWPASQVWSVGGEAIRVVDEVVYLGISFHAFRSLRPWSTKLMVSGRRASMALKAKAHARRVAVPELLVRLYDILVKPVVSYGCQIWAPSWLQTGNVDKALNEFDRLQLSYLRFVSGCSKTAPDWALLRDFSVTPIQQYWWRLVVRYWNDLLKHTDWLAHKALLESVQLAGAELDGRFWAGRVLGHARSLRVFNLPVPPAVGPLDGGDAEKAMASFHGRAWHHVRLVSPDQVIGKGARLCAYYHWFRDANTGTDKPSDRGTRTFAPHLSCTHVSTCHFRNLQRFRLGGWPLEVNVGRHHHIPRCDRVCPSCLHRDGSRVVEDERHVLLTCPHYDDIRAKDRFSGLFQHDTDDETDRMNKTMNNVDTAALAALLSEIWHRRFSTPADV